MDGPSNEEATMSETFTKGMARNVSERRGGGERFKPFRQAWMKMQPLGVPGRRAMPQFNLKEQEVNDLSEFLKWSSKINTNNWPPNKEG